ncbi:MAG: hypothetical protein K0Q78_634, partial [Cellvibrio sp.]|nr:hypothetical protein [Cellvibrio sp.]
MRRTWIPGTRLIIIFALLATLVFINAFSAHYFKWSAAAYLPQLLFIAATIIALLDWVLSRRLPPVEISRELPGNLA